MRYSGLLPLAVLAVSSACADRPRAAAPTEPEQAAAVATPAGASTICAAYAAELGRVRAALEDAPADEGLRSAAAAMEVVLADACH